MFLRNRATIRRRVYIWFQAKIPGFLTGQLAMTRKMPSTPYWLRSSNSRLLQTQIAPCTLPAF